MTGDEFAAMLAGLLERRSVQELAGTTGLSRQHVYRLAAGRVPRPSHDTVERVQKAAAKYSENYSVVTRRLQKRV